ncbi:uncharacterized protein [Physcomitrium patens]|uniref:uncharacterized protein isoform X2 n=1 Tax=Physcomitrium patens TaxID=3218 RepID=UPI003CCE4552
MALLTACGKLSFKYVLTGEFEVRSYNLSEMHSKLCASRCVVSHCRASGRSESSASELRIGEEEDNPFVKPLSNIYSVVPCRFCKGEVKCEICDGQGSLARGGFHRRNPVSIARIVGSNWTAMERTLGRHHFFVYSKRRGPGKEWFLEMVSACDDTTRLWINAKILRDRERWSAGWLQRGELHGIKVEGEGERQSKAVICKGCKGRKTQSCQMCAETAGGSHQHWQLDIIDV